MHYREKSSTATEKKYFRRVGEEHEVCEMLIYSSGLKTLRFTTFEKKKGDVNYSEVYENKNISENFSEKWVEIPYAKFRASLNINNPNPR